MANLLARKSFLLKNLRNRNKTLRFSLSASFILIAPLQLRTASRSMYKNYQKNRIVISLSILSQFKFQFEMFESFRYLANRALLILTALLAGVNSMHCLAVRLASSRKQRAVNAILLRHDVKLAACAIVRSFSGTALTLTLLGPRLRIFSPPNYELNFICVFSILFEIYFIGRQF